MIYLRRPVLVEFGDGSAARPVDPGARARYESVMRTCPSIVQQQLQEAVGGAEAAAAAAAAGAGAAVGVSPELIKITRVWKPAAAAI